MIEVAKKSQILLSIGDQHVSSGELWALVEKKRKFYRSLPSSLMVLKAWPRLSFVTSLLALLWERKPVAVLNPWAKEAEQKAFEQILSPFLSLNDEGIPETDPLPAHPVLHPETALILMTSGSTGRPRAVQLSEKNIRANIQAVIQSLAVMAASEQVLYLPLSYSFGLLGQLLPALQVGVRTYLLGSFSEVPAWIAEHGFHGMWSGVPPQWIAILRLLNTQDVVVNPSHIISAGGRLDLSVRKALLERFPEAKIFNNYGLTEASPRLLSLSHNSPWFLSDAVGFPVGDWKIRWSEDGELIASGSQVMLGYLGEIESGKIVEGWLKTGDMGRQEGDGCVFLSGRQDHLVKVSGERISLAEVESILSEIPSVRSACVLAHPHAINENSLEAYLELKGPLSRGEALAFLRKRLSAHKIPFVFKTVPTFPLSSNGKIDRRAVKGLRDTALALE